MDDPYLLQVSRIMAEMFIARYMPRVEMLDDILEIVQRALVESATDFLLERPDLLINSSNASPIFRYLEKEMGLPNIDTDTDYDETLHKKFLKLVDAQSEP